MKTDSFKPRGSWTSSWCPTFSGSSTENCPPSPAVAVLFVNQRSVAVSVSCTGSMSRVTANEKFGQNGKPVCSRAPPSHQLHFPNQGATNAMVDVGLLCVAGCCSNDPALNCWCPIICPCWLSFMSSNLFSRPIQLTAAFLDKGCYVKTPPIFFVASLRISYCICMVMKCLLFILINFQTNISLL